MSGEAPDDASVVSMLTTEHFTLQTARSATISEANGRAATFLSTVSGVLLALTLLGNASRLGLPFVLAAFALGLVLVLLGLTTFQRLLEAGIEDVRYGQGINRIRRYYLSRAPHLRPYFVQSEEDDLGSVMANMGIKPGRTQMWLTGASGVAVVNAALVGALVGGVAGLLRVSLGWSFALAAGVGVLTLWAQLEYQRRFWAGFQAWAGSAS